MSKPSDEKTEEHFNDPQPGDRFQEMMSAWTHVLARLGDFVVWHRLGGGGGEVFTTTTEEFRNRHSYKSIPGYWMAYYDTKPVEYLLGYLHEDYLPKAKVAAR